MGLLGLKWGKHVGYGPFRPVSEGFAMTYAKLDPQVWIWTPKNHLTCRCLEDPTAIRNAKCPIHGRGPHGPG